MQVLCKRITRNFDNKFMCDAIFCSHQCCQDSDTIHLMQWGGEITVLETTTKIDKQMDCWKCTNKINPDGGIEKVHRCSEALSLQFQEVCGKVIDEKNKLRTQDEYGPYLVVLGREYESFLKSPLLWTDSDSYLVTVMQRLMDVDNVHEIITEHRREPGKIVIKHHPDYQRSQHQWESRTAVRKSVKR